MIKHKLFSAIATLLIIGTGVAQPTLTDVNSNPVIGDMFTWKLTNAISPGTSGANQTWNLNTLSVTSTSNYTVVSVASTPSPASFPNANVSLSDGSTTYGLYKTSVAAFQNYGTINGTVTMSYSNPEDYIHYPFNYNNTYVDAYACTYTAGGVTFYRTGTTTVTADGHGTLVTPAGTLTSVMRVHLNQVYKDSSNPGFPFIINYVNDEYLWYKTGIHAAAASVYSLTINGGSPTSGGHYINNIAVGLNENSEIGKGVNLYPVPVSDVLTINSEKGFKENVSATIYNATGQRVKTKTIETNIASNFNLDVSDLSTGVYFMQINMDGVLSRNLRFVICR